MDFEKEAADFLRSSAWRNAPLASKFEDEALANMLRHFAAKVLRDAAKDRQTKMDDCFGELAHGTDIWLERIAAELESDKP